MTAHKLYIVGFRKRGPVLGFVIEQPLGMVVVHNHVKPAHRPGTRGFRAWFEETSAKVEPCDCGWRPELGRHFRMNRPAR
jgi:hypothetical protein